MTRPKVKASYLFATPCFVSGFARAIDIGATYQAYNLSENGQIADYKALCSDWLQVGEDITTAMEKYKNGIQEE